MTHISNGGIFWMDKFIRIFLVDFLTDFLTILNQLTCRKILNTTEVLLRIYNGVIISSVGNIKDQFSQLITINGQISTGQIRLYIPQFYPINFFSCLLIIYFYQSRRGFHSDFSLCFRFNQPFLYTNRYGTDSSMAAHWEASARLYKKDSEIIIRVCWRIKNAAAHHIVPSRFEH